MESTGIVTSLADALFDTHHCSSPEEAQSIAEAIADDLVLAGGEPKKNRDALTGAVFDYFGLTEEEALEVVRKAFALDEALQDEEDKNNSEDEENAAETKCEDDDADFVKEEEEEEIGEGECELCERFIQLTRHHLIPRSKWPRIRTRLLQASEALSRGDEHRASIILGPGLEHLKPRLAEGLNTKAVVMSSLQRTCDICRPCHTAVHHSHDNMMLAQEYNTVEKLLQDETVYKFCKWASKQKTGKYTRK